ncbi:hypothetical protein Tco_0397981 [Tanacetum coccineum]
MILRRLPQFLLIGFFIRRLPQDSPTNFLIQTASIAASEAAMYSACVADIAIVVCFLLFHLCSLHDDIDITTSETFVSSLFSFAGRITEPCNIYVLNPVECPLDSVDID